MVIELSSQGASDYHVPEDANLVVKLHQGNHAKNRRNNMNYLDAIASVNASSDPTPEDVVNDQLEWEQERRGIDNGNVCDDGFRWSDEINFNHHFGR